MNEISPIPVLFMVFISFVLLSIEQALIVSVGLLVGSLFFYKIILPCLPRTKA